MQPPEWFRDAVARPAEVVRVDVGETEVAVRTWGPPDAPALALVHGGGAHGAWWDHIAPLLADTHRVLAPDLSGHGDSGRRRRYDFGLWGEELLAVLRQCAEPGPVTVCGHSIGSFVALCAADRDPGRIGAVIAVDPPVEPLTEEQLAQRRRMGNARPARYPDRAEAVAKWRPLPVQSVLPYVRDHIAERSVVPGDGGWTWKFDPANFDRPQPTAELWAGVRTPVTIFRAEHGMSSRAAVDLMARQIAGPVSIVELPATGHHVMLDQPLVLVAALRTALGLADPNGWR